MRKDLEELASEYGSLTDTEKIDLEVKAHGEVTSEWFLNRSKEINNLIECSWFYLQELGVAVGNDGRLRLKKGIISEVPRNETKNNLKSASDFISDYFSVVIEYIEHPNKSALKRSNKTTPGGWGSEEFIIGLIKERRFGDF